MQSRQVYTPQMIVNGSTVFVGSSEKQANEAVVAGLKAGPKTSIQLAAKLVKPGKVQVKYNLTEKKSSTCDKVRKAWHFGSQILTEKNQEH